MSDIVRKFLFWSAAQLPLVGVTVAAAGGPAALWHRLSEHPAWGLLIFGTYQALIGARGIATKVWAKLEPDVVNALTEFVRTHFLIIVSRFRRRYIRQVVYDHRRFNMRGLLTQSKYALKLSQVFVDLKIAPNTIHSASVDPLNEKQISGSRPIWDFLRENIKEEAQAIAILGPPGSGKTTLLQHVALTFAMSRHRRHRMRAYLPLLLFLRDHVNAIAAETQPTLGSLAEIYFSRRSGQPKPPPDWFERELRAGRCVVLLDGLDEVANDDQRQAVSIWVDHQIKAYPRSLFVLTARPDGYRSAPLQGAHVLEVQPFGTEQVRRFISNWYLANEIMRAGGHTDEGVRQDAAEQASQLIQRLRQSPALAGLTRNPLLLTMVATVHSYRGALPGRRVELYSEICDVLLGNWRLARGLPSPLTATQLRGVLEPLAAHMMHRHARELPTSEVLRVIKGPLERVGVSETALGRFLQDLQATSGLFLERERDRWGFAHLTFQEFLAAARLRKQGGQQAWNALIKSSWWHETLRLYAVLGDATHVLRTALDIGSVPALILAIDFLEEATEIEHAVRVEAEQRVRANLEAPDPELRRRAAEVRLARRLRSLYTIDEIREIDLSYVTCAEYQIFLDDMRQEGQYMQPDHWKDQRFPAGHALSVVRGVRATDANAFMKWLSKREGSDRCYRLPTAGEVASHPSQRASSEVTTPMSPDHDDIAAWCDEADPMLAGLSREREQALLQKVSEVISEIPIAGLNVMSTNLVAQLSGNAMPSAEALQTALDRDLALGRTRNIRHHLDTCLVAASQLEVLTRSRTVEDRSQMADGLLKRIERSVSLGLLRGDDDRTLRRRASDRAAALCHKIVGALNHAVSLSEHKSLDHGWGINGVLNAAYEHACELSTDLEVLGLAGVGTGKSLAESIEFTRSGLVKDLSSALKLAELFAAGDANLKALGAALRLALLQAEFLQIEKIARDLESSKNVIERQGGVLVRAMLELLWASTAEDQRTSRRSFVALFAEYNLRIGESDSKSSQTVGIALFLIRVISAREAQKLTAWEGIRILREHFTEGDGTRASTSRASSRDAVVPLSMIT